MRNVKISVLDKKTKFGFRQKMLYLCTTEGETAQFPLFYALKIAKTTSKVVKTSFDVVKITSDVVFRKSDVVKISADFGAKIADFSPT